MTKFLYILNADAEPEPCDDLLRWGQWFEQDERRVVRKNTFPVGDSEVTVSTVFLGLDHSWQGGPPVLWETMIFGGDHEDEQWRYTSRDEAIANHEQIVNELLASHKDS